MNLIKRLFDQKNYGLALEYAKNSPSQQAKIYQAMEEPDIAEIYFIVAADRQPKDIECQFSLAKFYFNQQRYRQCKKMLEILLEKRKNNWETWMLLGRIFEIEGDLTRSLSCQRRSVKLKSRAENRRLLRRVQDRFALQAAKQKVTKESLQQKIEELQKQIGEREERTMCTVCTVCLVHIANLANNVCGHCCVCSQCVSILRTDRCPVCNQAGRYIPISKI